MGGPPEEDQKTVDLVYELASNGLVHEIQVSINTPQPGTDFYISCTEKGLLKNDVANEAFDGNGSVVVEYPNYTAKQIQKKQLEVLAAFDRGKVDSDTSFFMKNAKGSFEDIPKNSDILVLRSARQWMIQSIIKAMSQYRKTHVDLIGQDTVSEELKSISGVERVYSYGNGFFSPDTIKSELIQQLRANTYDFVLIPMTNNHIEGYRNVLDVAHLIGSKQILGVYPEGKIQAIQ